MLRKYRKPNRRLEKKMIAIMVDTIGPESK